ncbi:MAG TPA: lipoyl(octanoyl) transferase [Verrucomicrobiae bacterium]|nr:lipoyl(octanoyl) transferase [Verrucomicrobiae bacterium]
MISVVQLGTIDYATGLRLQEQLIALRKEEKIGDVLLLLEHSPVITLGRNAKAANVIASQELLAQRGVELFECDRGGDVTFHGPGQLVGYPIFDLRGFFREGADAVRSNPSSSRASRSESDDESKDLLSPARKHIGVIDFVRRLEEVLMRTCADFAIPTKRVPGLTGVWTDFDDLKGRGFSRAAGARQKEAALAAEGQTPEAKLAAIGVHISRFVTSHGFALNVNTGLSYFDLIIPCGITSKPVTSMQRELGREVDLNVVAESLLRNFGVVFQSQILWLDSLDALLSSCGAGAPPANSSIGIKFE